MAKPKAKQQIINSYVRVTITVDVLVEHAYQMRTATDHVDGFDTDALLAMDNASVEKVTSKLITKSVDAPTPRSND